MNGDPIERERESLWWSQENYSTILWVHSFRVNSLHWKTFIIIIHSHPFITNKNLLPSLFNSNHVLNIFLIFVFILISIFKTQNTFPSNLPLKKWRIQFTYIYFPKRQWLNSSHTWKLFPRVFLLSFFNPFPH